MRMTKHRIARKAGFEKCLIPWKELMYDEHLVHVNTVKHVK